MAPKNRRTQSNFNLQPAGIALNGQKQPSLDAGGGYNRDTISAPNAQSSSLGKIEVAPRAIAHVASRAAQGVYGVVGLATRNARPGWVELLRRDEQHKGVEVAFTGGTVIVDLYVVIEYGTRISEVARNVMSSVKFSVESALSVQPVQVNVNVQDIRVSSPSVK